MIRGYRIRVAIIAIDPGGAVALPASEIGAFNSVEIPADSEGRMTGACALLFNETIERVSHAAVALRPARTGVTV